MCLEPVGTIFHNVVIFVGMGAQSVSGWVCGKFGMR